MKSKYFAALTAVALLVALFSLPQLNANAQEQGPNLFNNPGFEAGYYNQNNISQIAVPNGWRMHWLDNVAFEGSEGVVAYRPETVVWNIEDAPQNERALFFRDGSYTLKIFKGWAPMYAALSQDVSGLTVGQTYRISAPIYIDLVSDYTNGKVPPPRADSGFVQFGVAPTGTAWLDFANINYSGYWTAETIAPFYLSQPIFVWDFVATASDMTIWIEVGSRHPYRNNGFFIDGVGLYAVNPVAGGGGGGGGGVVGGVAPAPSIDVAEPNADGSITHVVQAGETMWTIAITYAEPLGLTPEQALPRIQELNGNPAFLTAGRELIIREATGNAPPAEETTDSAEEAEETDAESDSAEASEETTDEESAAATNDVAESAQTETEQADTAVQPAAAPETTEALNAVCVTVYEDANQNGTLDAGTEALQPDAAVTLFRGGSSVSTHISDGITEAYCFEDLESDTYQVQVFAPANYRVTSSESWAIALTGGNTVPISFGLSESAAEQTEAVAAQSLTAETDSAAESADSVDETAVAETAVDGGNFFTSPGGIVLIIALILLLLAGAGVALLRRG